MSSISTNSSIRHEMYRRELLRYMQSMTIKFHPFAELMEREAARRKFTVVDYRENPYYRNLAGEYSCLDINPETGEIEKMQVYSVEEDRMVPFDKQLWKDYPQTASLYTLGSDAYNRLCMSYPEKVGLIKSIIYPVESIDAAYNAEELTLIQHDPGFLRSNEQESLVNAAKRAIAYVRDRWYVYDLGHEDQYYIVFMSALYCHIFQALLRQRIENQDTAAVHSMHVWDRLEANGLGPYEGVLNDAQARWFYRNMRYLKENRGRKSNLILLADNILKNLKVHLVGKRIFQQTYDPTQECIEVPEFLSEEIVDYSLQIAESLPDNSKTETAERALQRSNDYSDSLLALINTNSVESMDFILSRVYGEGYYPNYSVDDSAEKEYLFGRTVSNTVPTRLLEFQKYIVHAPYERHMAVFLYDSLQLYAANYKLKYKITFVDPNTNIPVELSVPDAMVLLHYACYRRYDITPLYVPVQSSIHLAYRMLVPRPEEIPEFYWWNGYKYFLDSIVDVEKVVSDIPWINNKNFTNAQEFAKALGYQYQAFVGHIRNVYLNQHTAYNWAMTFLYKHLLVHEVVKIREERLYSDWIGATLGVTELLDAYEELPDKGESYNSLCDALLEKLIPIEASEFLVSRSGALFDDSKYYTQLKNLFQEWTSHDLTYLDTDRSQVTYISDLPQPAATVGHEDEQEIEITALTEKCRTHLEEEMVTDLTVDTTIPKIIETVQYDEDSLEIPSDSVDGDIKLISISEQLHNLLRPGNLVTSSDEYTDTAGISIPTDYATEELTLLLGGASPVYASDMIELTEGE